MQPSTALLALASAALALPAALVAPVATRGETPLERAVEAFQAGKYAAVAASADVLPRDAPDYPKLRYLVGEAELLLQRPADAQASFGEVLELRPRAVPALVGLGRSLVRTGRFDEAGKALERALALEPKDLHARATLGELQLRRGEVEEALETLTAVHRSAPEDLVATQVYFEALLTAQDSLAAAELAEDYARRRPEHPLGYFLLAVIMERDGADGEAIQQYQLALAKDDTFLDAHKNLAILCHTLSKNYSLKERVQLAYEHYERYFDLGGGDLGLRAAYEQLLQFKDQLLGS